MALCPCGSATGAFPSRTVSRVVNPASRATVGNLANAVGFLTIR